MKRFKRKDAGPTDGLHHSAKAVNIERMVITPMQDAVAILHLCVMHYSYTIMVPVRMEFNCEFLQFPYPGIW